uniref:Uncharacterized protein n=1 Tax=Panagrolaimus sp. JU765 TaxID=591449 RepID=A0AC34QFG4_9BILA
MWIASYLIDTNGLRIENLSSGVQQAFFSNDLFEGSKQVDRLKSRSESVTKDHFFDYLVVVLDDKFTLDEIRAVVEVCKSKSRKCRVISPLLARLNFAVSMLPQPLNLYDHLIVITLTGHLCDIHVLCKSDNQIIFIRENLLDHNDPEVFKIVKLYLQRKIVLIHDESNRYLTFPLVKEFPEVTMFEFENWNSVLIEGGLQKARSQINPKEFESIKDFLPGFSCQTYDQSVILCTMGRPLATTNVRKTLAVGEKLEIKQGIQLTVNDENVLIEGGLQKARSQVNPKEFESIKDFLPGFSCQTYDQSIVLCTMGRPLTTTNVRKTLAVGEKLEIKQGIQLTVNDEKFERFSQAVKTLDCTPGKYDFNFEFIVDGSDCVEFKISKQPCQDVIVKKPPNQFGFLVYHMFSTNLCFSENINKSTFFKLTPPLSKDASIPQKLGEKNCQALFNGLPKNAAVKSSVLVHSGDFSKSLVEQAYEKAKKLTSKVVIISELMAQLQNAALYLPEMNE